MIAEKIEFAGCVIILIGLIVLLSVLLYALSVFLMFNLVVINSALLHGIVSFGLGLVQAWGISRCRWMLEKIRFIMG